MGLWSGGKNFMCIDTKQRNFSSQQPQYSTADAPSGRKRSNAQGARPIKVSSDPCVLTNTPSSRSLPPHTTHVVRQGETRDSGTSRVRAYTYQVSARSDS